MSASVTIHSQRDGFRQAITISKTDVDKAHIKITSEQGSIPSEDVKNVQADPTKLTMICQIDAFFLTGDISIVVQRGNNGKPPAATITVANAIAYNGVHVFPLEIGDDNAVQAFLGQADFPLLPTA